VSRWLEARRKRGISNASPLFRSLAGRPMDQSYVRDRADVHSHDAALAALYDERPRVGVEVLRREGERLADAEPAAPHDCDQRPVAHSCRRSSRAPLHQ
jgi:hypothetical protein